MKGDNNLCLFMPRKIICMGKNAEYINQYILVQKSKLNTEEFTFNVWIWTFRENAI